MTAGERSGAAHSARLAAAHFWVSSGADFGRVLAEQGTAIHADIGQFSDAQPIRGRAEIR